MGINIKTIGGSLDINRIVENSVMSEEMLTKIDKEDINIESVGKDVSIKKRYSDLKVTPKSIWIISIITTAVVTLITHILHPEIVSLLIEYIKQK
jgi:hypothetical protein